MKLISVLRLQSANRAQSEKVMGNDEILMMAEVLSREKGLDETSVFEAIEAALATATRKQYREDIEVRVAIDRKTGDYEAFRQWEIVEDDDMIETPACQMTLAGSEISYPDQEHEVGGVVEEPFETVANFGRIEAQAAKQVIVQKVREAERKQVFEEYEGRVGELVSGIVKRVDRNGAFVDLGGNAEGFLPREELIPREPIKPQDRIKSMLSEIRDEQRGPQLFMTRTSPQFLVELFKLEVPEVGQGLIEIIGAARDPGLRAKIAVKSNDNRIDPVGACVGMRGSRVQAVVNELQGEKIDIVSWSDDPAIVVSNALSPAEVQRVNVDNELKKLDVILTEENLSKAIGRRGQNVRLATKLINYEINIMTDQEDSERRQIEFKEKTENFVKNLELDETLGQLLVAEGFSSIDDIKDSAIESISKIEGIEEETAKELIERAKEFYQKDQEEISKRIKDLGLDNELINHVGLTPGMLVTLGEQKILKLSDFADLASDELTGAHDVVKGERIKIKGYLEDFALSKKESDELIMSARNKIYKD